MKRSTSRYGLLRLIALLASLMLVIAACGDDDDQAEPAPDDQPQGEQANLDDPEEFADDLYEKAKAAGETKVSFYTSMVPAQFEAVKPIWEAKYPGIALEHVRADLGQTLERVLAEHRAGQYVADVISSNEASFGPLSDEGLLAEFEVPSLDKWIEPFKSNFNGVQFPSRVLQIGLAVNTNEVPENERPTSWADLVDSKWKGRLGIPDPRVGGGAQLWFLTLWDHEDFGEEWFEKLAANEPLVKPGIVQVQQSAELGEVDVDVVAYDYIALPARDEGKPVDFIIPEDGTMLAATYDSVAAKAPNPNAARLLVTFLMSEEGQQALTKAYVSPVHADVKPNPKSPDRGDIEILSTAPTEEQIAELDEYVSKMNEVLNLR